MSKEFDNLPLIQFDFTPITKVTIEKLYKNNLEYTLIAIPPKPKLNIDLNLWDKARIIGDSTTTLWKILVFLYQAKNEVTTIINFFSLFKIGAKMNISLTTIAALVSALAGVLSMIFKWVIPSDVLLSVSALIFSLGVAFGFWKAADSKVETPQQK